MRSPSSSAAAPARGTRPRARPASPSSMRGDGREHLRAGPVPLRRRRGVLESLERSSVGAAPKKIVRELERLEREREVVELGRQLGGGPARDARRSSARRRSKSSARAELRGRGPRATGSASALVRLAEVLGRGRRRRCSASASPSSSRSASRPLRGGRLVERPARGTRPRSRPRPSRSADRAALGGASSTTHASPRGGDREHVRRDLLRRRARLPRAASRRARA